MTFRAGRFRGVAVFAAASAIMLLLTNCGDSGSKTSGDSGGSQELR